MDQKSLLYRIYDLYVDGFRTMTVGRTLWAVIIVKLIIIFVVVKWLFFPDYLKEHAQAGEESEFVAEEVLKRVVD